MKRASVNFAAYNLFIFRVIDGAALIGRSRLHRAGEIFLRRLLNITMNAA